MSLARRVQAALAQYRLFTLGRLPIEPDSRDDQAKSLLVAQLSLSFAYSYIGGWNNVRLVRSR